MGGACQEVGAGAGDEAEGIIARLHVLPEVDVGVVEDIGVQVEIVEALWRQYHPHIIAPIKERHRLQEEVLAADLRACQTRLLATVALTRTSVHLRSCNAVISVISVIS